jgi:hypothetical protein
VAKPELRTAGIVEVTFGENVTIVQPVNLYGCVIGDDGFISHGVMFINDQSSAAVASPLNPSQIS